MRRLILLIIVFSCIVGVGFYLTYDPGPGTKIAVDPNQSAADLAKVEELINTGEWFDALEVIGPYLSHETPDKRFVEYAIIACEEIGDPFNLMGLYSRFPEIFANHEKAGLVLARFSIFTRDKRSYEAIRENWKGNETDAAQWFLLDVDYLILKGEPDQAKKLVATRAFQGKNEADRLIRLAHLTAKESLKEAWNLLNQAAEEAPKYPEVYVRRGQMAERGRNASLAQSEYMAALALEPKNPVLRDTLAEFYRRHEQYKMALQTWAGGLEKPSADVLWLKTLFWSKMVYPVQVEWDSMEVPAGNFSELVKYMKALPQDTFWDEALYAGLSHGGKFLSMRQETLWLRLLSYLKNGEEGKALELINLSPFRENSWNPELEVQLNRVLNYRVYGQLAYESTPTVQGDELGAYEPQFSPSPLRHQFFEQLSQIATEDTPIPPKLKALLESPEVFSAVFMAAGWIESALQLHELEVITEEFPEWMAFGLTQCLRQNRNSQEALDFAKKQPGSPALSLIIGELQVAVGNPEKGLETFKQLMDEEGEIGFHAAWMAANVYISQGQLNEAKELVKSKEKLSGHLLGRETLARIAMLEGDEGLADRLYGQIEADSTEAKSYLAKRAFAKEQWKRARELTEELLMLYPSHPVLQENLKRILYAERRQEQNIE